MSHPQSDPRSRRTDQGPAPDEEPAPVAGAPVQPAARARAVLVSCRGTWLVHRDHTEECTEGACDVPAEAHEFVVDCSAVLVACGCAAP